MSDYMRQERALAKRLSEARKERGLMLEALAAQAGGTQISMLAKILRGEQRLTIRYFLAICDAMNIDPAEAIQWAESPPPERIIVDGHTYLLESESTTE